MNRHSRSHAFDVLKRVLKARGMTYADLADRLGVSEPTIKRLFVERDCKFSRLESICQLLDLSVADVLEIAERAEDPALVFSREVEQALADSPALFHFYLLLRDEMSPGEIAAIHDLDEADLHLYARDLERLGLATIGPTGHVTPSSNNPLRLAVDGPLQSLHAQLNIDFLTRTIADSVDSPEAYITLSRRMRPETARLLQQDVTAMVTRIAKLARQDRLTSGQEELQTYKWSFAHGTASFASLFSIGPHPAKKRRQQQSTAGQT
ncbi:helix-turn-helix domain-containing protein [Granulosicoccus sp. 3-233]|uniref:helix-turn-helix domain-containing protein n=1 Tax=Granulosicoccus sp. 3-233 TaxID=3417969 RepID=UPI003D331513